jgi:short-subunit dehydrogenase
MKPEKRLGGAIPEEIPVPKRNATAAVIGAGDFMGGEIAKKFAAEGFSIFAGRRNGAKLEPLVKDIEKAGGEIHARSLDARKEEEIISFLNDADKHAPLEVCIFNIGANVNFPILDTTERCSERSGRWLAIPVSLRGARRRG